MIRTPTAVTDVAGKAPVAEIDAAALRHNWRRLAALAAPGRVAAVVKADSYGLGACRIVPILAGVGCTAWYVATAAEAVSLRRLTGPDDTISVLNGPCRDTIDLFSAFALTPVLNSPGQIALWIGHGPSEADAAIHVDTGMNRLGLEEDHWRAARDAMPHPSMLISHLACAWTPSHAMNETQARRFTAARDLFAGVPASLANSAGAFLGPKFTCDEIRVGIGLYGAGCDMRAAVRMTAPVLQVRRLRAGCSTGYDGCYVASSDMDIACVGAGYADGLLQSVSHAGYGFINSERRPLLGRVSMDTAMIDVRGLAPRVQVGDTVELFGPDLPMRDQADALGISDYMLLTGLGPRVARTVNGRPSA